MAYQNIEVRHEDGVDWVTFNRPAQLNTISPEMAQVLQDYFGALYTNHAVRVVVLKGAGRAFCAGLDLKGDSETGTGSTIDGDVAHAESYSLGIFLDKGGETGRILAGRYIDRLEKRDGVWRIALRRATVEIALQGKATLPNGNPLPGSNYLRGNRDRTDPSYERPLTTDSGARW